MGGRSPIVVVLASITVGRTTFVGVVGRFVGGGAEAMRTEADAELFAGLLSAVLELTETRLTIGPGRADESTSAVIVTLAPEPAASVPTLQMIVWPRGEQLPGAWLDRTRRPVGSWSVTTTLRASDGPAFWTEMAKVTVPPTAAGFGEADFEMLRSAVAAPTV